MKRYQSLVTRFALVALLLLALLSMGRGIPNAMGLTDSGASMDLHSYWAPARILLHGQDPYAVLRSVDLSKYGIGHQDDKDLPNNPANTPLLLLLLSPLGLFSWPQARLIYMIVNVILGLIVPLLAIRLLPFKPDGIVQLAFIFAFLAILPTRNTISNGQTSLLILACAELSVLLVGKKTKWLAGMFLGVALSKFSLTLPLALWFFVSNFIEAIAIAVGLQIIGWLVVGFLSSTPPLTIFLEYYRVAAMHANLLGDLGLSGLGQRLGAPEGLMNALLALITITTLAVVWWYLRKRRDDHSRGDVLKLCILAVLMIVPLVLVYHRAYDGVMLVILPVVIYACRNQIPNLRQTSARIRWGMWSTWLALLFIWGIFTLPRFIGIKVVPLWEEVYPIATGIATFLAYLLSLGLVWIAKALTQNAPPRESSV